MESKAQFKAEEIPIDNSSYPSSHASTIVELPSKDLLSAWYAGSSEGAKDVAILSSRLRAGSNSWTKPEVLIDTPGKSEGNPVLFVNKKGLLFLFYVTIFGRGWDECKMFWQTSSDNGLSWGKKRVLREEYGWMIRNKPIILRGGDILLPVYDERDWHSLVMVSEDEGENWKAYGKITTPAGNIQPTVVQLSDESLLMYLRTGGEGGYIFCSKSYDNGRTWTKAEATNLPNPNSGIDLLRLKSGNIALAFNDTPRGRTPLNVALSLDEGKTWAFNKRLETEKGEFSYPAIIQDSKGNIHLTYTNRRVNIKHVTFNEAYCREIERLED